MTTFADSLKKEIARVARKEMRAEIDALRKGIAGHRQDVSSLKKQVKSLQGTVNKLEKMRAAQAKQTTSPATPGSAPAAKPSARPGRKVTFSADRLITQRKRLGFTQVEMGKLLDVSSLTIWKWESGHMPRDAKVPTLIKLMSLGKREAKGLIAAKG